MLHGMRHPVEYLAFIKWIATPEIFREQKTQGDFSEKFGIGQDTLSEWKSRDGFWDEVRKETRAFFKEKTPLIVASIYKKLATNPDGPLAKIWLQYIEEWKEEQVQSHKFGNELTPEEQKLYDRITKKNVKKPKVSKV